MKWILIVLINLITFSTFAQECNWDGLGADRKEELKNILLQTAREKLDSFLIKRGIVRTWEEPMNVEIQKYPDGYTLFAVRFKYRFKTQRSEFSTVPNNSNDPNAQIGWGSLKFFLTIQRDEEGYVFKKICSVTVEDTLRIPLFNLTLNDYLLKNIDIGYGDTKIFEIEIPIQSNME